MPDMLGKSIHSSQMLSQPMTSFLVLRLSELEILMSGQTINFFKLAEDTVSEWLRRWTRNPLGSTREGSNPFGVVFISVFLSNGGMRIKQHGQSTQDATARDSV